MTEPTTSAEGVVCQFCWQGQEVEDIAGKLHAEISKTSGKLVSAHHKCMQYASGLSQYRFDAFGGFAIEEVESEINRGAKLRCFICKGEKAKGKRVTGAVCGCAVKSCRKTFHFVCAHEDDQSVTKRLVISRSKNKRKFVLYRVFCSSAHEVLFRSTLKEDLRKQKKFENTSSEDNSDVSSQPTLNLSISGHETSYIDSPLVNGSFAPKTFVPADISVVKNSAESFTSPVNKDSVLVNHKTPDSTAEESKENTVENMRTSNSHTSDRRRSNNFGKARHSIARVSFPPGCSPLLEADESDKESEPDIPNETTESFLETLGQKSPQLIIEDINLNCPVNFDQGSSTPPENIPAQKEQTVSEASAKSPGSSRSPKSQTMTQSQQIESLDKTVTLAQKKEKNIVLRTSPRKSLVSSHTVTNVPARIVVADVHIRGVVDADGVNEEPSMKKSSTLEVLNPTELIKPSPAKGLSQRNVGQGELNSDHSKDDLNPRDSISASANDVGLLAVIGEMETEITSTVDIAAPTHIKEMVNSSPAKVTHPGSPDTGLSRRGRPPKRKRSPLSRQEDGIGKKVEETKRKFDNCLDEAIVLLFPSDVEKFRKAEERFMALASAEMNTDLSKIFVWQYLMPITLKPYLNVFIIHEVIKSVGESVDRSSLEELLFNRETVQKNVEVYKQQFQFFEGLQDDKVEEELATVFWSSLARKIEYLFPAGTNKHQIARILHLGDESILALNLSILDDNHSLCALLKAQTGLYRWTENTTPATFPQLSIDARHRATTFECLILQTWFTKVTHVMDTVSLPQDPQMLDEAALTSNKILTNFVNSLEVSINASKSNFTETDSRQETNPEFPLLLIFKPIDFEVVNFQQYFQKVVRNALVERQVPRVLALLPTTNLHTVSGQTVLELVSNNYIISGDNLLVKMWSVFRPEDHPTSLVLVEISRQEAHGVSDVAPSHTATPELGSSEVKKKRGRPKKLQTN